MVPVRLQRLGLVFAAAALSLSAGAQEGFGTLNPDPPAGKTTEQIVAAMGARETEFAKARDNYVYRQSVKIQTINDDNGKPSGEYQAITDVGFTSDGKRTEHVLFAPQSTIENGGVIMNRNDFDDIEHRLPFVLTTQDLPEYNVGYVGSQKVDELDTYVLSVAPKVIEKNRRYFKGKVWVDQRDLQIVLASGKNVPDDVRHGHEDLSPPFSTYYEQIDGKYWFPTYTKAEGTLHFTAGEGNMAQDVHLKAVVKYTDYKRYRSSARILSGAEEVPQSTPKESAPKK